MRVARYGKFAPDAEGDSPPILKPPVDDVPPLSVEEEWKRRQEEQADPRTPIKLSPQGGGSTPIVPEVGGSGLIPLVFLAGALFFL